MAGFALTSIPGLPDIELPAFYDNFAWYYLRCELQTKEWFVRNAEPDWIYIDCGANIGYYSILFSRLSPNGLVHAVEPTSTADMLEINVRHNNAGNVAIHRVALGETSVRKEDSIFRIWGESPQKSEYQFVTVDDLVYGNKISKVDCIKIDVDSFDFEVLKGASRTLSEFDPWIVIELNNSLAFRRSTPREVLLWLKDKGYGSGMVFDKENFIFKREVTEVDHRQIPIDTIIWLVDKDLLYWVVDKTHNCVSEISWGVDRFASNSIISSARSNVFVTEMQKVTSVMPDFPAWQCFQYASFVKEFSPDCVMQFGRWTGEYTAALIAGMRHSEKATCSSFISFCRSAQGDSEAVCGKIWDNWGVEFFNKSRIIVGLPEKHELEQALDGSQRVLVFWNEPSEKAGDIILGQLLPLIRGKEHTIIVHGVSDGRFSTAPSYEERPAMLALGEVWSERKDLPRIVDFCIRNKIPILSPQRAFHNELESQVALIKEIKESLGSLFSTIAGWHWFTLNGHSLPILFPCSNTQADRI